MMVYDEHISMLSHWSGKKEKRNGEKRVKGYLALNGLVQKETKNKRSAVLQDTLPSFLALCMSM